MASKGVSPTNTTNTRAVLGVLGGGVMITTVCVFVITIMCHNDNYSICHNDSCTVCVFVIMIAIEYVFLS